jgi:hypothetical protein
MLIIYTYCRLQKLEFAHSSHFDLVTDLQVTKKYEM